MGVVSPAAKTVEAAAAAGQPESLARPVGRLHLKAGAEDGGGGGGGGLLRLLVGEQMALLVDMTILHTYGNHKRDKHC